MGFSRTQGALVASVLTVASVASVAFQSENMVDAATKVTLSKTEYTLKVGESFKLKLKGAKAVKFASTNKKVAKVSSSGKVKRLRKPEPQLSRFMMKTARFTSVRLP